MTKERDIQVLHEFVPLAREVLSPENWDYLMGAADTETTYKRNRQALDAVAFRPRVLRDVSQIDSSGELFGLRQVHRNQLRDAAFDHRHAEEAVHPAHGERVVGDDDETGLGFGRHLREQAAETLYVRIV